MHQRPLLRAHRILVLSVAVVVLGAAATPPADADPLVTVRVTIQRIKALDDFEGGGSEDFYACVMI